MNLRTEIWNKRICKLESFCLINYCCQVKILVSNAEIKDPCKTFELRYPAFGNCAYLVLLRAFVREINLIINYL